MQQRKFFRDSDDEEDSDDDDWLDEDEEYVSPIDDVDAFIFFADAMKSECGRNLCFSGLYLLYFFVLR